MTLFIAKCHKRPTLRKIWRQTGNSPPLPTKCWPLLHVTTACSWRWSIVVAGISARVTHLFWKKSLNAWSLGNSKFCFPRISMFPTTSCRETMRFSRIKLTVPFRPVNKCFMFLFEKRNHHLHMWTFYWQRNLWQNANKITCYFAELFLVIWRVTVQKFL